MMNPEKKNGYRDRLTGPNGTEATPGLEDAAAPLERRAVLVRLPNPPQSQQDQAQLMEWLKELNAAAAADQHPVLGPTHIIVREGEIAGYLSLGGLPMVQAWFDRRRLKAADSVRMIEHGETALRERGVRTYGLCCAAESPFTPHLERLGFQKLGATVVWLKQL